jgi:hypothetical protein
MSDKWVIWQPGVVVEEKKQDIKRGFQKGKKQNSHL